MEGMAMGREDNGFDVGGAILEIDSATVLIMVVMVSLETGTETGEQEDSGGCLYNVYS